MKNSEGSGEEKCHLTPVTLLLVQVGSLTATYSNGHSGYGTTFTPIPYSVYDDLGVNNYAGHSNQCPYSWGGSSDIDVVSDYGGGKLHDSSAGE